MILITERLVLKDYEGIISSAEAADIIKNLMDYALKIKGFLELSEENKEDLIQEIFNSNDLEYFEKIKQDRSKVTTLGPIQIVRNRVLLQFIKDIKQNLTTTSVDTKFVKNIIENLISQDLFTTNKNIVKDYEGWKSNWKSPSFSRILLFFYDNKYLIENRKKILGLIKFFLAHLELEEASILQDYHIDDYGKFQGKVNLKNLELKQYKISIIDFQGSRYQYADRCWFAIFSPYFEKHQKALQLFLSINPNSDGMIEIGIVPGDNFIKRKEFQFNPFSIAINPSIDGFFDSILKLYEDQVENFKKYNELENLYRNFREINYWAGAPQPLDDDNNDDPKKTMFEKMLTGGYYALGWGDFQENLINFNLKEMKEEFKKRGIKRLTQKTYINFKEMKISDIIIARKGESTVPSQQIHRIYGLGVVISNYKFDPTFGDGTPNNHYREIKWFINFYKNKINSEHYLDLKDVITDKIYLGTPTLIKTNDYTYFKVKSSIEQKLKILKANRQITQEYFDKVATKFNELEEYVKNTKTKMFNKAKEKRFPKDIKPKQKKLSINIDKLLSGDIEIKGLFFENTGRLLKRIGIALKNGKHIILIGPPGTGKSKLAVEICKIVCGEENFIMSTATSDWTTFDTIGGYRLKKVSNNDNQEKLIDLEFSPGIFLKCFKDENNNDINKWLIIDEINRGDIDKAFGSLFSALAGSNITLSFEQSGKPIQIIGTPKVNMKSEDNKYFIPSNWRIIGTMNTFDKTSLYDMSYAFMRRFAFIQIGTPNDINNNIIKEYTERWRIDLNEEDQKQIVKLWNLINTEYRKIGAAIVRDISKHINSGGTLGSSLMMYVFPQFEGLNDDKIKKFLVDIVKIIDSPEEIEELKQFASDFFEINRKEFEKTNKKENESDT